VDKAAWLATISEIDDILGMAVVEVHERACQMLRLSEVVHSGYSRARRGPIEVWGNADDLVEVTVVLPDGEEAVVYKFNEHGDCKQLGPDLIYATLATMRKEMILDDLADV